MNRDLRFLPEVETDAGASFDYYELKSPGLGAEFLRVFYAAAADLPRRPLSFRRATGEFRRRLLRRFPYALYFTLDGDTVIVCGLFHCARDPRRVRSHLRSRRATDRA